MMSEESGYEIVQAVERIAEIIRDERARTSKVAGADGTRLAGHIAAALRAVGARLPDANANRLRWPLTEQPIPKEDPTGYRAAASLVSLLAECLRRGPGEDRLLELAAEVWPKHEGKADAEREIAKLEADRADAEAERVLVAHKARLAEAAKKARMAPPPATTPAPAPVPPARGIRLGEGDGEFAFGDGDAGYGTAMQGVE